MAEGCFSGETKQFCFGKRDRLEVEAFCNDFLSFALECVDIKWNVPCNELQECGGEELFEERCCEDAIFIASEVRAKYKNFIHAAFDAYCGAYNMYDFPSFLGVDAYSMLYVIAYPPADNLVHVLSYSFDAAVKFSIIPDGKAIDIVAVALKDYLLGSYFPNALKRGQTIKEHIFTELDTRMSFDSASSITSPLVKEKRPWVKKIAKETYKHDLKKREALNDWKLQRYMWSYYEADKSKDGVASKNNNDPIRKMFGGYVNYGARFSESSGRTLDGRCSVDTVPSGVSNRDSASKASRDDESSSEDGVEDSESTTNSFGDSADTPRAVDHDDASETPRAEGSTDAADMPGSGGQADDYEASKEEGSSDAANMPRVDSHEEIDNSRTDVHLKSDATRADCRRNDTADKRADSRTVLAQCGYFAAGLAGGASRSYIAASIAVGSYGPDAAVRAENNANDPDAGRKREDSFGKNLSLNKFEREVLRFVDDFIRFVISNKGVEWKGHEGNEQSEKYFSKKCGMDILQLTQQVRKIYFYYLKDNFKDNFSSSEYTLIFSSYIDALFWGRYKSLDLLCFCYALGFSAEAAIVYCRFPDSASVISKAMAMFMMEHFRDQFYEVGGLKYLVSFIEVTLDSFIYRQRHFKKVRKILVNRLSAIKPSKASELPISRVLPVSMPKKHRVVHKHEVFKPSYVGLPVSYLTFECEKKPNWDKLVAQVTTHILTVWDEIHGYTKDRFVSERDSQPLYWKSHSGELDEVVGDHPKPDETGETTSPSPDELQDTECPPPVRRKLGLASSIRAAVKGFF